MIGDVGERRGEDRAHQAGQVVAGSPSGPDRWVLVFIAALARPRLGMTVVTFVVIGYLLDRHPASSECKAVIQAMIFAGKVDRQPANLKMDFTQMLGQLADLIARLALPTKQPIELFRPHLASELNEFLLAHVDKILERHAIASLAARTRQAGRSLHPVL